MPEDNSALSPSIQELLRCSFVIIDKPRGPSSHEVAAWVRKLAGASSSVVSIKIETYINKKS